jgi:chromate reductase, NAD(P)H dehydrogenase (quinone)
MPSVLSQKLAMEVKSRTTSILAISGSLRQVSSNTSLLLAAINLSPPTVEMNLYNGLGDLPHFNPDLETTEIPAVMDWKAQVKWADGLLICSPEYAHGVPGVLKNALDWLVSDEDFAGKPIALLNASHRATHAQASLVEILTTMAGRIVPEASVAMPLQGKNLDAAGILADPELVGVLRKAMEHFVKAIAHIT